MANQIPIPVIVLIPVLLLLSACGQESPVQPSVFEDVPSTPAYALQNGASMARPLKGEFTWVPVYDQGTCTVTFPDNATLELARYLPSTGTVTHAGRSTNDILILECGFDSERGVITVGGSFLVRSANGDEFGGPWEGILTLDGRMWTHSVINRGTGRFHDARGWLDSEGTVQLGVSGWFGFVGEISY